MKKDSIKMLKIFVMLLYFFSIANIAHAMCFLVIGGTSGATLTNGGFETGSFVGWETIGNVSIVDSSFGTGPPEGNYQALLTTGSGAVSGAELEAFLGFHHDTFDNIIAASAIKQTFMVDSSDPTHYKSLGFLLTSLANNLDNTGFVIFLDQIELPPGQTGYGHIIFGSLPSFYYVNSSTRFEKEAENSLVQPSDGWVFEPMEWLEPGKEHIVAIVLPDRLYPSWPDVGEKGLLVDDINVGESDKLYIPDTTNPPSASMIINNGDSHTSEREVTITLSFLQEDATEVSGEIVTDIVWNLAGSPYTLVGDLQINSGVRLTIEDGVVVNNPDGYQILVYGTIQAEAVLNNPVVFNDVAVNVASAGTVIFDYAVFNQGHIRNNLGFQHFTITNCRFNETSYLRINARTDSYFDRNTLTNAGYVELVAYTSSHDRDIYARWNSFYGKHPTLALKSCFKVSYEGSDRLVIHSNNFLDENNYGISLHTNTSPVDATNNHWGSTDPAVIAARINDSNDNASILGTVQFDPYADVPYSILPSPSDAVYMSFSNDGTTFSAWESYSDSKTWTLSDGDGTKEVFARFKDEAGNISTVSDSIILDTTAPTGTIEIDGGSSYCLTRDVSLALNSADTDYMQFSNDGVSYVDWEPYAASKDWLLTAGEGVKTVYVKLKDAADNVSTFNDTIVLDTTAPTGNLTVNGGNDYATASEVTLTINSDNAAYVCFSNDGVNYSSWESYLGSKTWTLSEGDGTKTVYVKYKDEAGNTFVVSQGILYDSTAPNAPVLIDIGTTGNDQPTLDWQIVSDAAYYVLEYGDNVEFNNVVLVDDIGPSEYEVQSVLADGTWYWRVMAVDPAGNESDWSLTGHFTIDTSSHCYSNPEKPVLISPENDAVNVSLRPVMNIQEPLNTAVCNYPLKIRWRISEDADFKGLVEKVNPKSKDLTTYQPSNLILESGTTYYWKVRILGSQENNSEWSDVFSFTTQPLEGDENGNGIQDEQEVDVSDDLDNNGKADSLAEEMIKSFKAKAGNIKMGILPNNCDLTHVEALETESVSDDGDKPTQVPYGLVSYRLKVSNYGDTATVKIYLSLPAPENAKWVFYDSLEGWQDFSNHAVFNSDRTLVTVQLKDGGYGDNDHVENKVIVDPSGVGIYGAGSSGGGSSGGGGCFITTVIPW